MVISNDTLAHDIFYKMIEEMLIPVLGSAAFPPPPALEVKEQLRIAQGELPAQHKPVSSHTHPCLCLSNICMLTFFCLHLKHSLMKGSGLQSAQDNRYCKEPLKD